ncbi:MAG TPA: Ku protein [Candidatus Babeliales bacterium]|nr:Ku protein [Candidatus Babeliales bacterium]
MRRVSSWKGSLSFGLVQFNIELYSAIASHSLGFNLLHAKCHTPIANKRMCPKCNKEVAWSDLVKGLKLEDGSYFIITKENLEKLKPEKTDSIRILEFVDASAIDPIYLDQHYYMLPQKQTDRAFFLFGLALQETDRVAIGQFVMRDKEYVCAIQPHGNILLATTLNYDYEIKELKETATLKIPKFEKAELNLAEQLINKLTVKKFSMSRFKDTFAQELKKKIAQAAKGKKLEKIKKVKEKKAKPEKEHSLMQALRKSIKTRIPTRASEQRPVARAKSRA